MHCERHSDNKHNNITNVTHQQHFTEIGNRMIKYQTTDANDPGGTNNSAECYHLITTAKAAQITIAM